MKNISKRITPNWYRFRNVPFSLNLINLNTYLLGQIFGNIYWDVNNDPEKSLIVCGTARGGKTWLSELINYNLHYRFIYEPLAGQRTGYTRAYVRPDDKDEYLRKWFDDILTGRLSNSHLNRKNIYFFCKGKLLMDAYMSLMLKWFHVNFPNVPIVFIIRNPMSVVSSWMKTPWATPREPDHWLNQKELVEDYLLDYKSLISKAETDVEKFAIEWCVMTYVPLKQFQSEEWLVVTYEELILQPRNTLEKVSTFLATPFKENTIERLSKPTHTAREKILEPSQMINKWKDFLSKNEVDVIRSYVEAFQLTEFLST